MLDTGVTRQALAFAKAAHNRVPMFLRRRWRALAWVALF